VSYYFFTKQPSLIHLRDDLTVEVIFFGDSPSTGNVTLNKEASAPEPEVRANL
jgi:pyruvate dehydrogenase phosphatase